MKVKSKLDTTFKYNDVTANKPVKSGVAYAVTL